MMKERRGLRLQSACEDATLRWILAQRSESFLSAPERNGAETTDSNSQPLP